MDWEKHRQEINKHVIYAGSIHDIRIDLGFRMEHESITVDYLKDEIELEKSKSNRSTVIKLLEAAIRKLQR
jgi:hypothetical protein